MFDREETEPTPRPPLHALENERLTAVRGIAPYMGLEDEPMKSLARQAADACGAPLAMVSLMEEEEQRFLACVGRGLDPTPREETFCAYCILQSEPMVVENALEDARFRSNPHVAAVSGFDSTSERPSSTRDFRWARCAWSTRSPMKFRPAVCSLSSDSPSAPPPSCACGASWPSSMDRSHRPRSSVAHWTS